MKTLTVSRSRANCRAAVTFSSFRGAARFWEPVTCFPFGRRSLHRRIGGQNRNPPRGFNLAALLIAAYERLRGRKPGISALTGATADICPLWPLPSPATQESRSGSCRPPIFLKNSGRLTDGRPRASRSLTSQFQRVVALDFERHHDFVDLIGQKCHVAVEVSGVDAAWMETTRCCRHIAAHSRRAESEDCTASPSTGKGRRLAGTLPWCPC